MWGAMADERTRAHVFVEGHVQGVFYRSTTQKQARDLGVHGWVRNLDDGRVEAVFEGDKPQVDQLVQWCQTGSPKADVDDVDVTWEDPEGLEGFEIRR